MDKPLEILLEDNHLLAVNKPAGLPTMGVTEDRASLVRLARDYIKRKYHKPGNVYLGVVSRLDAAVSGVIVLARTSKAAARLSKQFAARTVHKSYWAIIAAEIAPPEGRLIDHVVKDEQRQRMVVTSPGIAGAQEARLAYRLLRPLSNGLALVEVSLETGRKHQVRLQLAARGYPVVGDLKYGSREKFGRGIALHSRRLQFAHPITKARIELIAPPPSPWQAFGITPDR